METFQIWLLIISTFGATGYLFTVVFRKFDDTNSSIYPITESKQKFLINLQAICFGVFSIAILIFVLTK
jgi:hypothetical protein